MVMYGTRCCGVGSGLKSVAYVSWAREIVYCKFTPDYVCKS
jgi:hypothetical protein